MHKTYLEMDCYVKKGQISYMSDMSRSSTMDFNLEHIVSFF